MSTPPVRDDPRAEARFHQALELHMRGQIGRAQSLYREVLQLQPNHAEALHHLGIIALQMRDPANAMHLIGQAVTLNPANPAAHSNLGMACEDAGQPEAALASYDKAIALRPDHAEAILNRGNVLQTLQRWSEALGNYDRLIALAPHYADPHNNRGNVLRKLGRRREALESYSHAIRLKPDFAQAYSNRGVVQKELRDLDEALASFDQALERAPDNPEILNNRANALHEMGRLDEAMKDWNQALTLDPGYVEVHINRGNALRELGRLDEAAACFTQALRIDPEHAGAQWTLSLLRLLRGDYEGGLPLYEARWKHGSALAVTNHRDFRQPRWTGDAPIAGRTILLHAEQGLGDTLQFCRYATRVAALGARVVLEVQRPLVPLMQSLEGVSKVIAAGEQLPEFDLHCPLLSLPLSLRTTLANIPWDGAYLHADQTRVSHWRARLGPHDRPRIGLVWCSGLHPAQPELWRVNKRRDVPFDMLAEISTPALAFYSLQKGDPYEGQTAQLQSAHWHGNNFYNFASELHDFADTAALVANLDLVVSVDTAVAHLAGAMAKPAWVMLPFAADWRWLTGRTDSAWYPTLTLYRQNQTDNWRSVVDSIKADLSRLL